MREAPRAGCAAMKILAIVWTECSTAAVMVDGRVIACTSEERFSRIKNDERYPRRADWLRWRDDPTT